MDGTKWGLALLLACPACTGGSFLAVGVLAGVGAATFRSAALLGMAALLLGLWGANIWRRRGECPA